MTTFLTVQKIFYSGGQAFRGNKELVNDIAFLLDENYLTLSQISLGKKEKYLSIMDEPQPKKDTYKAAGGGKNHVALKLLAGAYLKTRGFHAILYEHPFCGYYPDVMTGDNSIIAECGHTDNADKILAYFQRGGIRECLQIPYPTYEDDEVFGYSFVANRELKEFLDFLEGERRNELRKIHKNINGSSA